MSPPATPGVSRLAELLRAEAASGFPQVSGPRPLVFPADHGPHPEYRNEWWYFTGNLDGAGGERFGYELTVFRFALAPTMSVANGSQWQTNQVYIGHFAVTDTVRGRFLSAQRYARGSLGLAGALAEPFRVWVDDWAVRAADAEQPAPAEPAWLLSAADDDLSIELELVAEKPIVANGDRGYSRKSAEPGNASYYYSIPRLRTRGQMVIGDTSYTVSGLSWLDREWGSSALSRDQQGWDWFSLQMSDGSDLMFYVLRRRDGTVDDFSAGTWIDSDGTSQPLHHTDLELSVTGYWENRQGGRYPATWHIEVPGKGLSVTVEPVMQDQELVTNVRYWEGAVDVNGLRRGAAIGGRGYVELTGYAKD